MSRDTSRSALHFHHPHHADLLEEFTSTPSPLLPAEDILIAPQHQPLNPEDEDDIVPDQHAAFGITRAMAARERGRERGEQAWRDFGGLTGLVDGKGLDGKSIAINNGKGQGSGVRFLR